MMQNNLMGGGMAQPATAPANPTGLNFQSDPSMRAQFKGFMSGMQAKQPAPMAPSPMQAPLPMPAPMQNVDIFQPQPMQMQMGGAVPRQAMMGGMPHMLSYITPGEASALSAMGGTGQAGPGGVPSFVYDEAGMGFSSDDSPSMGDASYDYSGGGYSDEGDGDPDSTMGYNLYDSYGNPIGTGIRGNTIAGGTIKGIGTSFDNFGFGGGDDRDALSTLMAREAARLDAEGITALGGMPEIEEGFGPMSKVTGTRQTPMDPTEFSMSNVKSIRDSVDAAAQGNLLDQVFDIDTRSYGPDTRFDIDTTYTPSPIATPDQIKMQQSLAADARRELDTLGTGPIAMPEQIRRQRDNFVPPSIDVMSDKERRDMELDELGISVSGNTIGGADQIGVTVGAPSVGPQTGNLGAMGQGSFPSAPNVPASDGIVRTEAGRTNRIADSGFGTGEITDAAGSRQPADRQGFFNTLFDTITGREFPTEEEKIQNILDANNQRTTVTFGRQTGDSKDLAPRLGTEGAVTVSALDQLAQRAGIAPGTFGDQISKLGPQGKAIAGFGASNAGKMYEDIVNKGYEPVYDARGQIVATRVPGTDILGRGSVEARIPGAGNSFGGGDRDTSTAKIIEEEIKKISNPPMASYDQVADRPDAVVGRPVEDSGDSITGLLRNLGFGYGKYRPVQGISSNLNTAADDFLNLLGGANVQNFAKGGGVPRQTEIAGQPHMLSYITPGEAAVLKAMGGAGKPGPMGIPSFYDEGDDYSGSGGDSFADESGEQTSGMSDSELGYDTDSGSDYSGGGGGGGGGNDDDGYSFSTNQADAANEQAKADAEARAALEAANLKQQQMAPKQQGIRDRISSVQAASTPSFADMLGDLFSFNTPDTMSDLERTQLDVRGRMADRGSSYYGQNLPQMSQDLARGGMTPANTQYMDVLSSGVQGGSRYGGGMQDIGVQYQTPQQVAAGVQQGVQGAFQSLGQQFGGQR